MESNRQTTWTVVVAVAAAAIGAVAGGLWTSRVNGRPIGAPVSTRADVARLDESLRDVSAELRALRSAIASDRAAASSDLEWHRARDHSDREVCMELVSRWRLNTLQRRGDLIDRIERSKHAGASSATAQSEALALEFTNRALDELDGIRSLGELAAWRSHHEGLSR